MNNCRSAVVLVLITRTTAAAAADDDDDDERNVGLEEIETLRKMQAGDIQHCIFWSASHTQSLDHDFWALSQDASSNQF